jgi:hypothetical protein
LIVTFSYFANVIEEVRELKMPAEYWRHLQMPVARLEPAVDSNEGSGQERS